MLISLYYSNPQKLEVRYKGVPALPPHTPFTPSFTPTFTPTITLIVALYP